MWPETINLIMIHSISKLILFIKDNLMSDFPHHFVQNGLLDLSFVFHKSHLVNLARGVQRFK